MSNETIVISQNQLETFQTITINNYAIGYYSQQSTEKKTPNEDSLLVMPIKDGIVLAVADGVGGSPRSYEASGKVLQLIADYAKKPKHDLDINHEIIQVISTFNKELIDIPNNPQTTLTLAIVQKNQMQCIQIGDSGLIACGQRGKIKYRSSVHSPVGYAVAAGMMNEVDAMYHPNANIIDNMIGDPLMKIELGPAVDISRFDSMLLATDGLFDNIAVDDIIEIIRSGPLDAAMKTLVDCCQQKTLPDQRPFIKDDDISFILCRPLEKN